MNNDQQTIPFGRSQWWSYLLVELPKILKRDPRVVQYIEEEFANPALLGLWDSGDICSQNYYQTEAVINRMLDLFVPPDWVEGENEEMAKLFLTLKEQVAQLQADGKDHSYAAYKRSLPLHSVTPVNPEDFLREQDFSSRAYRMISCRGVKTKQQLIEMTNGYLYGANEVIEEIRSYRDALVQAEASDPQKADSAMKR